jgi:hypothetical protein
MRYNHFEMLPELAFRPVGKRMTLEGGGGGSRGSSTTTQQLDPTIRPFVEFGLTEGQKLYQTDSPEYYGGQTFVSPSEQTQAALMAAQNRALQGNPLIPAAQQNLMNLQGATNLANPMFASIYENAQTSPELAQNVYTDFAGGSMVNAANPFNQRTASGAFLGSNPYFDAALRGGAQAATSQYFDAINQANTGASQAGRYGSGAQENLFNRAGTTLSNTLANQAGQLLSNQYNMERGLQESAIGRIGTTSAQDMQNRLAGAQALTGVGQQALANRLQAASGLAGTSAQDLSRQLQAGAAAPALAEADYGDIQKLLQVGQGMEDYGKTALQADIDRFNFEQNKPYAKLQTFLSGVYGAPQGAVSQTQQSGGGKIVCTAMNNAYGFGSFRQTIWLQHSANMKNAKTIEAGYHALFLPVVAYAFNGKRNALRNAVRGVAEHIARHRTADLWKEMRGKKRDTLGRIYRAILEPICYLVGKVKGA